MHFTVKVAVTLLYITERSNVTSNPVVYFHSLIISSTYEKKEKPDQTNLLFFFFNFATETGTVWPLTQALQRIQTANLGCLQG